MAADVFVFSPLSVTCFSHIWDELEHAGVGPFSIFEVSQVLTGPPRGEDWPVEVTAEQTGIPTCC